MKVSLIISTYNRVDALELCLRSALRQSRMPDEIIVGDDGSTSDTRALVERIAAEHPEVPILFEWHEDRGFRLARMRNRCIARASGDYIIQIDGDMVLSRHFVADHLAVARPGFYVRGSRMRLSEKATRNMLETMKVPRFYSPFYPALHHDRLKAVRLPFIGRLLSPGYHRDSTGLGANMAFWREDLLRVNGYDNHFEGWGGEDNDLEVRLKAAGVKSFKLFRLGMAFHLWHKESPNPHHQQIVEYINAKAARGETVAADGIEQR